MFPTGPGRVLGGISGKMLAVSERRKLNVENWEGAYRWDRDGLQHRHRTVPKEQTLRYAQWAWINAITTGFLH
jgi:hypothetical protein